MKSLRGEGRARLRNIDALILSAIFFGLIGCATTITPPETPSELIPSISRNPGELTKSLAQRLEQLNSLRALASVSYSGPEGRQGFQEAVVVRRPDRLRLETLSLLGVILVVTADGNQVAGYHPREGLFFHGNSSKENLFRYIQVPLELEELTALLMGLPPVEMQGSWEGGGNSIYRETGAGQKDTIVFDSRSLAPIKWERSRGDSAVELRAVFSDFAATSFGPFPLKINLEAPAQNRRLEIRYQDPELNIALPADLFVQQKPANVRELPIESLGG